MRELDNDILEALYSRTGTIPVLAASASLRPIQRQYPSVPLESLSPTRSAGQRDPDLPRRILSAVDAALRRVLPRHDHEYEDLRQSAVEAVLAALKKNHFRGDASLSTWAAAITRNIAVDALRGRSLERRLFDSQTENEEVAVRKPSSDASPELLAEVRQHLTHYHRALESLTPLKAQVLGLSDVLGHRLEEIATTLGLSVAATQSRLVRGRKEIVELVQRQRR